MIEQIFSHCRINFTVDRGRELARHASSSDWAVASNKMQSSPHRRASRAQNLADWLWFVCHTISRLCPRIDAEIKPAGIERRRLKQVLRKIVFRHTAICREVDISSEKCKTRDHHRTNYLK